MRKGVLRWKSIKTNIRKMGRKSLRSKAVDFVSDLTTVFLNPISDKPPSNPPHPPCPPRPSTEDAGESKRSQPESVSEDEAENTVEEPDTSSFTAFLYSLLSSSESGNKGNTDEQNDNLAEARDMPSENVKESGAKKGLLSRGKQSLRSIYQAARIGGHRSQECKGDSEVNVVDEDDDRFHGLEMNCMQSVKEPVALGDLPDASEPSLLLSEKARFALYASLPALVRGRKWLLLYSTWRHGISLSALYRRSMLCPGLSMLVVGD